jgi:hypothetical protein
MSHARVFSLAIRVLAVSLAMAALVGRESTARALQAPPPPVVATVPNLVAYWPFDETAPGTAQDFSGNANDGTPIGPTISTSIPPMTYHGAGANLRSLDFVQSSSQYVSVNSSASLSMTGSFTISAWIFAKSGSTNQRGIVTKWDSNTGTGGYDMRLEASKVLALGTFDGTPGIDSVSTFPRALTEDTWTHVAATYNSSGGIIKLYKNGVEDATIGNAIPAPTASGTSLQIGQAQGSQFFHGNIDEVRIYNRALLDTEIVVLKDGQEAPSGLVAAGQAGQIHLTWSAPTGGAPTSYSVLRGPSAGVYDTVFNNIPANASPSYDDTSATPGTTYYYVVVAVSVLASDYSNSSSAAASPTGPPPPPPPPRTKKLGERHMCGWSTVSASSWPGLLGALLLAAALGIPALRRRV